MRGQFFEDLHFRTYGYKPQVKMNWSEGKPSAIVRGQLREDIGQALCTETAFYALREIVEEE